MQISEPRPSGSGESSPRSLTVAALTLLLVGGEVGEEVVELLLLVVLDALQLLDGGLELLDLGLLLVELLQVALVRRRRGRHLAQVGAQPRLVVRDRLELA